MAARRLLLLLCASLLCGAAAASPSDPAVLTLLDPSAATCNDGTAAGYYVRRSNTTTDWVVYLQGGGFCFNEQSCDKRPSVLTSSRDWPSARVFDTGFLAQDMNLVFVPYCTSDLYTGTRQAGNDTYNGYSFLGSRVLPAVLGDMRRELAKAGQVVLAGSSAGGVGVFTNAEYMRDHWASISPAPLRMLPDAGWFLNSSNFVAGAVPLWVEITDAIGTWKSQLNSGCVADNPGLPSRCVMSQYVYPHVTFPTLVLKAQDDAWTVTHQGLNKKGPWTAPETAYLESLARNTTASFKSAGVRAVFSPGCVVHTMLEKASWDHLAVGGATLDQVVLGWWHNGTVPHLVDTCTGPSCNPTCPH